MLNSVCVCYTVYKCKITATIATFEELKTAFTLIFSAFLAISCSNLLKKRMKKEKFDEELFMSLYQPIEKSIYNYLKRFSNNADFTEDIMSECLVIAIEHFHQLRDKNKFKSWLWTIVKRHAISYMKKYCKETPYYKVFDTAEKDILYSDRDINLLERQIENIDNEKLIKEALEKLNDRETLFVTLFYFNSLNYKEISEITGDTQLNLRVFHSRLLKKMRNLIGEKRIGDGLK